MRIHETSEDKSQCAVESCAFYWSQLVKKEEKLSSVFGQINFTSPDQAFQRDVSQKANIFEELEDIYFLFPESRLMDWEKSQHSHQKNIIMRKSIIAKAIYHHQMLDHHHQDEYSQHSRFSGHGDPFVLSDVHCSIQTRNIEEEEFKGRLWKLRPKFRWLFSG